jgi:hypothetical protein
MGTGYRNQKPAVAVLELFPLRSKVGENLIIADIPFAKIDVAQHLKRNPNLFGEGDLTETALPALQKVDEFG